MVSITTAALALLASSVSAENIRANRRLSYDLIAGYEPGSQVTDHNAIDLDQAAMEDQLALANEDSYAAARAIYEKGAFSKSTAKVSLTTALPSDVLKGTSITGVNANGEAVMGKAYEDNVAGATSLLVQYKTTDSQKNYVGCQVGANPAPNTEGCFAATGTLTIDGSTAVSYSYSVTTDNINKRTIQGFSTAAQKKMYNCDNCPYTTYDAFYKYYGEFDYGNQIVLSAFEGTKTNFDNFNNDFGLYTFAGKEQIIKKATAYILIWMYVIREMEDALDDCKEACTIENCNDDPVHAWDEAVAFYTGTLEGLDGSGSGKLFYALADKRCQNFKTCGDMADSTTGSSKVNMEIFKNFGVGKQKLLAGQCASVRTEKQNIEMLMTIPLIQGTLRYAWKTDNEAYSEKAEAEGTVFALGVAPLVAACDAAAAEVIASNLVVGQAGTCDFKAVKKAFESVYDCMGVDAAMIGGLYDDATASYFVDAEPLSTKLSAGSATKMAVGAAVAALTTITMFL